MEDIRISATANEPCHYALEITVPAKQVNAVFGKTLNGFRNEAPIPGFRPGKSPEALLRRRFGSKIAEQATQELLKESVPTAIEQSNLRPVTMPTLPQEDPIAKEGEDFSFTIEFDVAPEVQLPEYKGVELTRPRIDVTEEMVDEQIENLRARHADYQVVERPAESGDLLKVSYHAEMPEDGDVPAAAKRMLHADNTWIQLTEPAIFPGATEKLIGINGGETRTFEVSFPDDYREEFLKGKSFTYSFDVQEVQTRVLPEMNDELAKTIGAESVEELRREIREYAAAEVRNSQEQVLQGQVYDLLSKAEDFPLPPRILQQEVLSCMRQIISNRYRQGAAENLANQQDEMLEQSKEMARGRVKMRYIMYEIAEAEGINVTEDEVAAFIRHFKSRSGMTDAQFDKQYDANHLQHEAENTILSSKVIGMIIEHATVTEKDEDELASATTEEAAESQAPGQE